MHCLSTSQLLRHTIQNIKQIMVGLNNTYFSARDVVAFEKHTQKHLFFKTSY